MRFDKRKIHPSLFKATEHYSQRLIWGGSKWSSEETKIISEHQAIWWKENGKKLLVGFALWFSLIIGLIAMKPYVEKPILVGTMLLWLFGGVGSAIWAFSREKSNLSVKELEAVLPLLELSPIQKAYAETLLAMEGIGMSDAEKDDLLGQLNRLLDEEERLAAVRLHGSDQPSTHEQILDERNRLMAKLEATTDDVSRQAFAKGLEICERRLAAANELSLTDERVEAQTELIRQAMCGVRDSLRRLRLSPRANIADLNLDHLNDSVFLAHRQAESLEAAVAEVRAISG
jgi:hypothetical protein